MSLHLDISTGSFNRIGTGTAVLQAIGSRYGECLGAWNFNLNFNLATDHHTDTQLKIALHVISHNVHIENKLFRM